MRELLISHKLAVKPCKTLDELYEAEAFVRSCVAAGLISPNFCARSTLFGFQRPGGGVSTSPNTSLGSFIPPHHDCTTSFQQWVKPREGQRGRNTKLTWNFFTSTRSFLTSSQRLWDKLQQTVTSPFPTGTPCVRVFRDFCLRSEHPAGSPSYLSHPPVLAASCPDGSVPRWVSGLIGSGDRGGGYNRAVSASGKPGRCSSDSERKRSVRLISQWYCSKQRLSWWERGHITVDASFKLHLTEWRRRCVQDNAVLCSLVQEQRYAQSRNHGVHRVIWSHVICVHESFFGWL